MPIVDLPDDILVHIFSRYVSQKDLCRLDQVCRRFHNLLDNCHLPWKIARSRITNVSYSKLKNSAGCPSIQNFRPHPPTNISHPFHIPADYSYKVLFDNIDVSHNLLANDQRPLLHQLEPCATPDCHISRTIRNDHYLLSLANNWQRKYFIERILVKFNTRAQTSILQYDEHNHQLWFTCDYNLYCLNLNTSQIDHIYKFYDDDILCYKVYNDHLICLANGDQLKIVCRQTNNIYSCDTNQSLQLLPGVRNDILSLDIYSNDLERYLIINGSRDRTVSMRTFDLSTETNQLIWQTRVDDRVLCTRFTNDGHYCLIGTGGTSNKYPLGLFNIERAQPMHLYDAQYRLGAGVRCIEWISSNVFIAAGFDSQFKEFDLRTGTCHYTFEDNFANDICSLTVSVDQYGTSNGIILGGNHHSTVRLVNRKQRNLQEVFYVSKERSPVHSLASTAEYLFASVDRSIVALDFTRCDGQLKKINYRF